MIAKSNVAPDALVRGCVQSAQWERARLYSFANSARRSKLRLYGTCWHARCARGADDGIRPYTTSLHPGLGSRTMSRAGGAHVVTHCAVPHPPHSTPPPLSV